MDNIGYTEHRGTVTNVTDSLVTISVSNKSLWTVKREWFLDGAVTNYDPLKDRSIARGLSVLITIERTDNKIKYSVCKVLA